MDALVELLFTTIEVSVVDGADEDEAEACTEDGAAIVELDATDDAETDELEEDMRRAPHARKLGDATPRELFKEHDPEGHPRVKETATQPAVVAQLSIQSENDEVVTGVPMFPPMRSVLHSMVYLDDPDVYVAPFHDGQLGLGVIKRFSKPPWCR